MVSHASTTRIAAFHALSPDFKQTSERISAAGFEVLFVGRVEAGFGRDPTMTGGERCKVSGLAKRLYPAYGTGVGESAGTTADVKVQRLVSPARSCERTSR